MADAPKIGWYPGMPSPNKSGRPKGTLDRRQKVQAAFADDATAVVRVVTEAAKAGDLHACSLVLARVAPPLRAQAERVQFALNPDVPLSDQAQQILQAVSEGRLDAETARTLIACMSAVAGIRAVEELEERLVVLEARLVA